MDIAKVLKMSFYFWIIMDALGAAPLFIATLKNFDPIKQRKIIIREMLIALAIMLFFFFFGDNFLKLLGISNSALKLAGGIILFTIAIRMIFGGQHESISKREPFIVPLATPSIAGPGILTIISLYSALQTNSLEIVLAIIIAWSFSLPILLLASLLKKLFGQNGLYAIEKLFGFIIVLISMQVILNGLFSAFNKIVP